MRVFLNLDMLLGRLASLPEARQRVRRVCVRTSRLDVAASSPRRPLSRAAISGVRPSTGHAVRDVTCSAGNIDKGQSSSLFGKLLDSVGNLFREGLGGELGQAETVSDLDGALARHVEVAAVRGVIQRRLEDEVSQTVAKLFCGLAPFVRHLPVWLATRRPPRPRGLTALVGVILRVILADGLGKRRTSRRSCRSLQAFLLTNWRPGGVQARQSSLGTSNKLEHSPSSTAAQLLSTPRARAVFRKVSLTALRPLSRLQDPVPAGGG